MGGSKQPQQPQFVTPPAPQIIQAPSPQPLSPQAVNESSKQLYESQLQYNPQLTKQAFDLQMQYGPQLAQQQVNQQQQFAPQLAKGEYDIQAQYGPLYRALYENLFPTQVQGQETLASQALQRLQTPQGLLPEQQAAQDAIRQRQTDYGLRNIRESSNVGGTLYGGRRQQREDDFLREMGQGYAQQDIGLQDQRRAQTLQELIASSQVVFPQVQQPGVPTPSPAQFGQSATMSPDALLQAMLGQSQNYVVNPAILQQGNPNGGGGMFGPVSKLGWGGWL